MFRGLAPLFAHRVARVLEHAHQLLAPILVEQLRVRRLQDFEGVAGLRVLAAVGVDEH